MNASISDWDITYFYRTRRFKVCVFFFPRSVSYNVFSVGTIIIKKAYMYL